MKQLAETLIKEWWTRPLPEIKKRDIDLKNYLEVKVKKIVSVVGFRRVGKTFSLLDLAKKIGQENCVYINFEDERIPKRTEFLTTFSNTLIELKGKRPFVLLLDEIQNIPDWSSWVRRVNETTDHRLVITGSSSKLSSSELPTELRGRSLSVKLHPLTFKEFLRFKGAAIAKLPRPQVLNLLREYVNYGGFPEIVLVEEGKKPLIIDEYFKTFLLRDVIERHSIRQGESLKSLVNLLLNSTYFTISKLANNLKSMGSAIGKATVLRYLSFLEESLFLESLELHTPNIKRRAKAERKVYFVDNYFLTRYSGKFSQNLGRLMENLVASEVFRRASRVPNQAVFYWKDYQGREIDFVVRRNEKVKELLQVSFVTGKAELAERELKSFAKASAAFDCQKLTLITWDWEGTVDVGGLQVKAIPLDKWLLNAPRT